MDDVTTILVLVAFGLGTGMLSGLLGVGGGIFMVPFLVVAIGLTQQHAQATSLLVILPTALMATASLRRQRVGDAGLGLRIGVLGAAGSAAGAALALVLPGLALRLVFAVLLSLVGVRLLLEARAATAE